MRPLEAFSDVELLQLFNLGDQKAYEEIYRRYWRLLYISCCKILKDKDEAQDIVQEVFISLLNKAERLHVRMKLSSYLYSAVRHKVLDKLKHEKVMENYLISLYDYSEIADNITDRNLLEKEFVMEMEKVIQSLPEKMRMIFRLSRNQYLSHKEIANMLQISDKTVKKQINNALKILKIKLVETLLLVLFIDSF